MLIPVALCIFLGLAAGAASGGRLRGLADLHLRAVALVYAAFAVMLFVPPLDLAAGIERALVTAAYAAIGVFLALNAPRHRGLLRWGFAVVALGWALNTIVITANGGMPLSEWAYAASGQAHAIVPGDGGFFKIVIAGSDTILRPLGDVIPLKAIGQVLSIGDFVLCGGLSMLLAGGMRLSRRAPAPRAAALPRAVPTAMFHPRVIA